MRTGLVFFPWLLVVSSNVHAQDISPPSQTSKRLAEGKPVTIVCFGDSITGVYYHTGGRRAYPEMLEIALRKNNPKAQVKVINAGISGHTTREALARIERDVLDHQPHLVTIMFGMNDLTRIPRDEFKKNLVEIKDRCQKAGAEVLLCTQNNVIETPGRPGEKLAEFTQLIRELAKEHRLGVADCHAEFAAAKTKDRREWRLLLSDEIHPNMAGHKLMAETIAQAILGKAVSLKDVGPPTPAIPRTLALVKNNKKVKILAMPPYDQVIGPALGELFPDAQVEVTVWTTKGKSLAQLEAEAKKVRGMNMDLVLLAVPSAANGPNWEARVNSYSWILNSSLSFGKQEWDVVAIPPMVTQNRFSPEEEELNRLALRLIAAQDLAMLARQPGEEKAEYQAVLARWLREQMGK